MRSLADLLHLRNASTSSTASASSTSTRSFGSPARLDSHDQDGPRRYAGTPTRPGHTPAQSMSAIPPAVQQEQKSGAQAQRQRQRAASTGVVRLMHHAGGSTPNLLGGRDESLRNDGASVRSDYLAHSPALLEDSREDLDLDEGDEFRAYRREGAAPQHRSTRRGGASVSSMGSVADAIAAESSARQGPQSTQLPPRPRPTLHQSGSGSSFSSSSMPWGQAVGRPPPSPSRRSTQSLAEREARPMISPISTTFSGSQFGHFPHSSVPLSAAPLCITPADKAAAIALRRRSRVRSNSASSTLSLNTFGLGPSSGPHSASASIAGSARSSMQLDAIDLPAQKPAPIGVPLPATPVETAPPKVVVDSQYADDSARTMSSYASSATIRKLNGSTTTLCEPATPRPLPTGSNETTPVATGTSHLPPTSHVRPHKLSPMSAGVRVKRDLSTVSFWKDGLESELDGIWAGMADSPAAMAAFVQERETRRRPRPPLVLADSFNRRSKELAHDTRIDGTMGGPPLSAVGRLAAEDSKRLSLNSRSAISPSVSDISLTNMQFPMPPTHVALVVPPSAEAPADKDAEEDDLTLQPMQPGAGYSFSARSSLSSGADSSDMPWYSSHERGTLRDSGTSSAWNRMRSPTWSSTTGSVASPRTPAAPSFENVAALPEVEDSVAPKDKANNIDQLARLLLSFDGEDEEGTPVYGQHFSKSPEDEGVCWGEAI